jgi:hypothetical protein
MMSATTLTRNSGCGVPEEMKEILRLSELISFLVLSRNFLRLAFSFPSIFPVTQT